MLVSHSHIYCSSLVTIVVVLNVAIGSAEVFAQENIQLLFFPYSFDSINKSLPAYIDTIVSKVSELEIEGGTDSIFADPPYKLTEESKPLRLNIKGEIGNYFQVSKGDIFGTKFNSNDLHYSALISAYGIPLSVSGDLYTYNFSFHGAIHSWSIEFDQKQLIENLKQLLIAKLKSSVITGSPGDSISKLVAHFDLVRDSLNDPYLLSQVSQAAILLDSMKKVNLGNTFLIDSLQGILAKYEHLKIKYSGLFSVEKELMDRYQTLDADKILHQPDIDKQVLDYSIDELKSKIREVNLPSVKPLLWLTNVKDFSIGESCLSNSVFTLYNTYINGIQFRYESPAFTVAFAKGNESFLLPSNLPVIGNVFDSQKTQKTHQNISFLRIGPGSVERRYLHLSISSINSPEQGNQNLPSNVVTVPFRNSIISLVSGLNSTKNNFSVESEIASSFLNFHSGSIEFPNTTIQPAKNFAYSLKAKKSFSQTATDFAIDLSQVDPFFKTLGNPYLVGGTNSIEVSCQQSFFKERIKISSGIKSINYSAQEAYSIKMRNVSCFIDLKSYTGKNTWVDIRYAPAFFSGNDISMQSKTSQLQLQVNSQHTILKKNSITNLSLSDFSYMSVGPSATNTLHKFNAVALSISESLQWSSRQSLNINLLTNGDFSKLLKMNYYSVVATDNLVIQKNGRIGAGLSMSNYFEKIYWGVQFSIASQLFKSVLLNAYYDLKFSSNKGVGFNNSMYSGNISLTYSF